MNIRRKHDGSTIYGYKIQFIVSSILVLVTCYVELHSTVVWVGGGSFGQFGVTPGPPGLVGLYARTYIQWTEKKEEHQRRNSNIQIRVDPPGAGPPVTAPAVVSGWPYPPFHFDKTTFETSIGCADY